MKPNNPIYAYFNRDEMFDRYDCPQEGAFIGWKVAIVFGRTSNDSCEFCLVQLKIPADSHRLQAFDSKKCRCEFAEVAGIQLFDGSSLPDDTVAYSMYETTNFVIPSLRQRTKYKKGEVIFSDGWDADRAIECGHGIHFFMHREDAISYVTFLYGNMSVHKRMAILNSNNWKKFHGYPMKRGWRSVRG